MSSLDKFDRTAYSQIKEVIKALGDAREQLHNVKDGICFSLCCQWIELHKKYHNMGHGEKDRVKSIALRINKLMAESTYFHRALGSQAGEYAEKYSSVLERKNEVGKKYGLVFSDTKNLRSADDMAVSRLARYVNETRSYTQTAFDIGKSGRHAICAYKSGGKFLGFGSHLYVFDPNLGEFRIPEVKIFDFYAELFTYYEDRGRHQIGNITTWKVEAKIRKY